MSGPELADRRKGMDAVEQRLRVLEVGHGHISEQIAELTLEQREQADRIEAAVERGIERGFDKLVSGLHSRAAEHTGRFIFSTIKAFVTRWLMIALIVIVIVKYVGPSAAWSFVESVIGIKK